MLWYDWVLWVGVLYMTIGSDIGLNWFTGVIFGKRIDKNSSNPFNRLYYYIWAENDPMCGPIDKSLVDNSGITAAINRRPLEPQIVAICQINMIITVALEILILVGMFTHGPYLRPAVFMFVSRGIIEMIYGSQLIWGKPGLNGWPLVNYLAIGLIPQTLVPFILAMRFASGIEVSILWWQPLVFVGVPLLILLWVATISKKNSGSQN